MKNDIKKIKATSKMAITAHNILDLTKTNKAKSYQLWKNYKKLNQVSQ